jgi:GH43 family beta-xylosidase
MKRSRFTTAGLFLALLAAIGGWQVGFTADSAHAAQSIRAADPSVIRVGSTYISVQSLGDGVAVRQASSTEQLATAVQRRVWTDTRARGGVWAPEIVREANRYYIYFALGPGAERRMFVISSATADSGYGAETQVALPGNRWAIDGVPFTFNGQRWFVWSGWAGTTNVEQNLYIARMSSPTTATGERYIISQPREPWERVVGNPYINESPQPIRDPNGQLHITYSANGSWSDQYCIADLRLRAGGDPTYVWDWYKSNGCLFGSNRATMMTGWDPTLYVNGPGHHSFVLLNGDIGTSPPAGPRFPLMFHAVPKGMPYNWENRHWHTGTFTWWGNITYRRANVPGPTADTGWSLKFFE